MTRLSIVLIMAYIICVMVGTNVPVQGNMPIMISMDSYPKVNIVIYAPDFNSSPYAIDTIGEDGSTVTISSREASIPYRLIETGPDTGYFTGSVILSSTTSTCSPVCGPNDGFLAAGGDDAITVSFTYAGKTISASSNSMRSIPQNHSIPENLTELTLIAGIVFFIYLSKTKFIR